MTVSDPLFPPFPPAVDASAVLTEVLDHLEVAACLFDAEDRVLFWNRAYLRIFPEESDILEAGLPYEATLRRFFEANLTPEEQHRIDHHVAVGIDRHRQLVGPYQYQRKDGRLIQVAARRLSDGTMIKLWTDGAGPDGASSPLRDAMATLDTGFAVFDPAHGFVMANRTYQAMFPESNHLHRLGAPYRDHLKSHAETILDTVSAERLMRLADRPEPLEVGQARTMLLRRSDGGWLQLEERINPTGTLVTMWMDVTDRHTAELGLKAARDRLADAMDTMSDGFALFDSADHLVTSNARFQDMFGSPPRAGQRRFADLLAYAIDVDRIDAKEGRRIAGWHRVGTSALDVALPDGRYARLSERLTADGSVVFLMTDTTRQRQAEQSLQDSEALKSAIVASSPDCIITVDGTGKVLEFNPAAEATFGFPRHQAIGRKASELFVPDHLQARHAEEMRRLREGSSRMLGRRRETEARRADGTIMPMEVTVTPVAVTGHRLFTATMRDLTDQKAGEQELERSREALFQAEKLSALGTLLAGVAHELNNPLAILVGNAVMLEGDLEGTPSAERAQAISRAADRCARIVKMFLAMARRRTPERRPLAINDVVRSALDLTAYQMRSSGVEAVLDLAADLPEVWADPDQLGQVVTNLLVNAQQALADQPGMRRLALTTRYDRRQDAVVLTVADNGPGIPADIRSRIFEPFFTTKPMGVGTGLGLALSRGLIEAHDGTLELLDRKRGASFVITLPRGAAEAAEAEAAEAAPTLQALSVLVVEDEPELAALMAELLRRDGHRVVTAATGRVALARLAETRFDVVVSDLHMPDMGGKHLHREIRLRYPALVDRVVFVTGDTLGPSVAQFLKDTAAPLVEKPFGADDLRRAIGAVLPSGSTPKAAAAKAQPAGVRAKR